MKERKIQSEFTLSFEITAPSLPYDLVDSAMAQSTDLNGVLLFGGLNMYRPFQGTEEDRILELRSGASSWTILNFTLQEKRSRHTIIPIP